MESVIPMFSPSQSKIECTGTDIVFYSMCEVSTRAVALLKIYTDTNLLRADIFSRRGLIMIFSLLVKSNYVLLK